MNIKQRVKYALQALTGRLPFSNFSMLVNGQLVSNFQNTTDYVRNGYMGNAVVYSIISFAARKFGSVPVYVYEIVDEKEFKRYKALTPGGMPSTRAAIAEALKARKKALKVVERHPLIELLKRPNPTQGGSAFFENLFGFKLITGAGTAWANRGGIETGEPLELWCLPSQDIMIVVDREDYLVPAGYQLHSGYIANLRKEDVLYWKYWNPDWDVNGTHLYGLAPLKAGSMIANERSKADRASATMLQNQGSKGVLFAKGDKGMSVEQRDKLEDRIDQEVNGIRNASRVSLANAELGYVDLGRSSHDLGVEVAKRMSKEDLCNVFGVPFVLFDNSKATYDNVEKAMKGFVTNKIIPEWCGLRDDFNSWIKPMYKNSGKLWVEPDFSALPELQEDLEKQVNAVMKIWPLTPNQMLEYLGWESDDGNPLMNERYIPANLVPLSEVGMPADDINDDVEKLAKAGIVDYK
ncbi:phage portal protein [Chitinophaga sp.]|uniref:phage portal protein n=1 Tax=Chitinophaga sp. TaxID=1869181 RepID=UPI0031D19249